MSAEVRLASADDLAWLTAHDQHIDPQIMAGKIEAEECLIVTQAGGPIGWLRWGYLWDQIPFMNMLMVLEAHRGRGYGRTLVDAWEDRMREARHGLAMTSTQSDEEAQHFYRKLGYHDAGGFILPGEPLELILVKALDTG